MQQPRESLPARPFEEGHVGVVESQHRRLTPRRDDLATIGIEPGRLNEPGDCSPQPARAGYDKLNVPVFARALEKLLEMTPQAYRERVRFRPLGGRSWTAPVVADGRLYVRNEERLACIDLR